MPVSKKRLVVGGLLSLAVVVGVVTWLGWSIGNLGAELHREGRAPFDAQAWRRADPDDGTREEMLDDLEARHLKRGVSKEEVLRLLGKTDGNAPGCGTRLRPESADSLCYRVSVGLDPCVLVLGFDAAGNFVEAVKTCS